MTVLEDDLFALIPLNEEAHWVVAQEENKAHWAPCGANGTRGLVFGPRRPSKQPGLIASFGRFPDIHDIHLPENPPLGFEEPDHTTDPRPAVWDDPRYQSYRNWHCYFYLAKSGELVLRDESPCLVEVKVQNASEEEIELYRMHGNLRRGPRQRVIPRTHRRIHITIGISTVFELKWFHDLVDSNLGTQAYLAERAESVVASCRRRFTPPSSGTPSYVKPGLWPRSMRRLNAPSVAAKPGPRKACHMYAELGRGGFGVVYKAVDLRTGELWAVKELDESRHSAVDYKRRNIDIVKGSLAREVDTMAKLRHDHIVHYETYQDSRFGEPFRIFYRLYEGNLRSLITHSCAQLPVQPAPWMPRMVNQMAMAIDYLHKNGIQHLDIKPHNILFDHPEGDSQPPSFYLGDFGLAMATAEANGARRVGTAFYMAPEVYFGLADPCPASDIWSFAMTISMALGLWCRRELEDDGNNWALKLKLLGSQLPYTEAPELAEPARREEASYRRMSAAVASGVLPPMLSRMLLGHDSRPTAAECVETDPDSFIKQPARPEPLKDWDEEKSPWLQLKPGITNDKHSPDGHDSQQRPIKRHPAPKGPPRPTGIPQPTQQSRQSLRRYLNLMKAPLQRQAETKESSSSSDNWHPGGYRDYWNGPTYTSTQPAKQPCHQQAQMNGVRAVRPSRTPLRAPATESSYIRNDGGDIRYTLHIDRATVSTHNYHYQF